MGGVLLTAGYDRALHSVAIAEGLRRLGCGPELILISYPMTASRLRTIVRSRGLAAIMRYLGGRGRTGSRASPLQDYLDVLAVSERSLRAWAKRWGVRCVSVGDINASRALRHVRDLEPSVTVYSGGGILRRSFIEAASRRVFNAHSGPLPQIRGMNACEWSLLLGEPLSVTIHLIDEGIDTGATIERVGVSPDETDSLDDVRERCVITGVEALVRNVHRAVQGELQTTPSDTTVCYRQCFVLAPALREILIDRLPETIARQREILVSA